MDSRYKDIVRVEGGGGMEWESQVEGFYVYAYYRNKSSCDADLRRVSARLDILLNNVGH